MPEALTARYPEVVRLLGTYARGAGSLPDEVGRYVSSQETERVLDLLEDIDRLLQDGTVADDELDAFTRAHSPLWLGSGRSTLEHVGETLMRVMEARAGFRATDDLDPTAPAGPPDDVHRRLSAWLQEDGQIPPDDYEGWDVTDAGDGRWVLTPPGFAGVMFAVTPDRVRAIRPAVESVTDALRELGIQ